MWSLFVRSFDFPVLHWQFHWSSKFDRRQIFIFGTFSLLCLRRNHYFFIFFLILSVLSIKAFICTIDNYVLNFGCQWKWERSSNWRLHIVPSLLVTCYYYTVKWFSNFPCLQTRGWTSEMKRETDESKLFLRVFCSLKLFQNVKRVSHGPLLKLNHETSFAQKEMMVSHSFRDRISPNWCRVVRINDVN